MTDSDPTSPNGAHVPFELLWLNINGINSNKTDSNLYLLLRLFVKSKYSIMFLQEPRLKDGKLGAFDVSMGFISESISL